MYHSRLLFHCTLLFLLLGFLGPTVAQTSKPDTTNKETPKKDDKWDVSAKHGPTSDIEFETSEGTWMAVDVSPDGKWIVFDLLGDIYTMPITGGEAKAVTSGPAYDVQPRFSPDGKKISFTSDRDGVAAARAVFDPVACGTVTTTTNISHPKYPEKPGLARLPGLFQQYILNFKGDHLCELTIVVHMNPGGNLPAPGSPALASLRELLADATVAKVGHDVKPDVLMLRRAGVTLGGVAFDTMIASFMVDPGRRSHELDIVVAEHFGREIRTRGDLTGRGKDERPFAELATDAAGDYCCTHADFALRLRRRLEPVLEEHALAPLFRDVELPLIGVLAGMEWEGIAIDTALFARLLAESRRELAELEQRIHAGAGTDFNILSTPQLRHVLFEKLMLPVLKRTKTGASTDADVLDELAALGHEVPQLLLEYREVSKLLSTYLEALPASVNPETGRIHTTFYQIGAATGRLSSSDPNLQNIPVRTARGGAIRKGFVPRPGWRYVVADYSQIELRLLAHLSDDPAFVAAFRAGGDIHRQTAAIIFGVPVEQVTAEQRARAKTINFATIYGQGPHALSRQLGIAHEEAKQFIARYFERFAGVRRYLDACVVSAREKGYAETIFGRRRYIPELKDRNFNMRAFGERTATNSPLQGSAADLIKVAMLRVARALEDRPARLLLQVHDELIVEAPAEAADAVASLVKLQMEAAAALKVPLVADVGIGENWLDAKAG